MSKKKNQVHNRAPQNDDYVTYRVMLAFIEAAVFLMLMSKLHAAIDTPTTYQNALAVCLIIAAISGVCAIGGAVSYLISVRRETYRPGRVFNGMFLAAGALVVMMSSLLLYVNHIVGMQVIYVFIPASAILFLIYSVYPKSLFITSATHIYVAFALYALRRFTQTPYRLGVLISALAVCAAALILYFATVKRGGCIQLAGVRFAIFGRDVKQTYLLALYGITAAVLVAAFFLGSFVAFYAMIATIVYLVCAVVYNTIRMM